MKITAAVQQFYVRCRAEGLSENTVRTYGYLYDRFIAYCLANKIEDVENVTADNIRTYLVRCRDSGYSNTTIIDIHRTLSVLFNYLFRENILLENPMRTVKRPKTQKQWARTFTASECDIILNAFDKTTFTGMRNYVIMCILLGTGIRKAELLNVRIADIDWDLRTLQVVGKGNKARLVPLSPKLVKILHTYINKYHITGNLLITNNGQKLSKSGLDSIFAKLKTMLPIPARRLSCHTFRHTFSRAFLSNGGNLFALQSILGHEDIATTRIYVDFDMLGKRAQMDSFSPLDNFSWKYN